MLAAKKILLLVTPFTLCSLAMAENPEVFRLQGFAQHQKQSHAFDRAREQGEQSQLEDEEIWEVTKRRALQEYKKQKKQNSMSDEGVEAQAHEIKQKAFDEQMESQRKIYATQKAKEAAQMKRFTGTLPSGEEELGLLEARPRFDYKKRQAYGGKPNYKQGKGSGGKSSSSGAPSSGFAPSNEFGDFPPPPQVDDFDNDGFPQYQGDDFGGDAPPPPIPVPAFEDDGSFNENDFPPPPPPPPPFDGEESDFSDPGF